jgi:glycosyltransferase involved in cell wall biosynthesis
MSAVRVAYLLKRFPRLSETFVLNEILQVRRLGIDVLIYALEDPGEALVHPEAQRLRSSVIYLHQPGRSWKSWRRLLTGAAAQAVMHPLGAIRVLWALVGTHRSMPSVRHAIESMWLARDLRHRATGHLHAHFAHSPAAVAYMAHLASGLPFSFTAHAKDLYTTLPRNLRIRCRAATFVVTCTDFNRRHLERMLDGSGHAPIHVIRHGTDLSRFSPAGRNPEAGRVLSVGRLVPKKGYTYLIHALAKLHQGGVGFRCTMFGGGALREELSEQINASGLAGRVQLLGARLQDEVIAAYRNATVFALAPVVMEDGDRDGIPNVLVEAMASGVPVVATRISGIPELIEDGVDGLLVEPGDSEGLAAAIRRVFEDPALAARLSVAGRQKVELLFDLRLNSRRLVALFNGQTEPAVTPEVAVA